jgi:hypothetical protein
MASVADMAAIVKRFESGGDYTAQNPNSTASGAYQFVNPTWRQYASQIGVDTGQYPTAGSAPPEVQDQVFAQAVSKRGLGDWTCPGCNPRLSAYLSATPGQQTGPGPALSGATQDAPVSVPQPTAAVSEPAAPAAPDVDPRIFAAMRAGAWNPPGTSALSGTIAQQPAAAEPMRVPLMPGSQLTLARRLG